MRASVTAAWPIMCQRFEGVCFWMYLDTKSKVTTGTGNLIDSVAAAQAIEWVTLDGKIATDAQVAAEWKRVKALTKWSNLNGLNKVWSSSAQLLLTRPTVNSLLLDVTAGFWSHLASTFPNLEAFPADAQLALMDEAWQNGKYFLDPGTAWTGTRAAVLAQNWTAAASHVPGTGARADARKRLFNNAAAVVKLGIDPEPLWDTKVPTAPVVPPVVPPPVTPPKDPTVAHSSKWGTDYVWFRGGNVPLVVRDILLAIPSSVQLSQGGLNGSVAASANTHLGLGAYDISVKGWSKAAISKLCSELISCGECAFPRGPRWGSPSFAEHVHVCSNNAYNSLHPDAQAQVRDFKAGRNGLVGHARYVGPSTKLGKWADSPWNPVNIQKAKDAAEAAARKKELELPTTDQVAAALATDKNFLAAITKAVVNADGSVPNTFTGNPLNKDVAVSTALQYLGSRSKKAEDALTAINAKIDALAAAVAAAFPEQPPAA